MNFNELVDEVKSLDFEQKEELKFLLEKYIVDERRNEIKEAYIESQKKLKQNDLVFSKDIDQLKRML